MDRDYEAPGLQVGDTIGRVNLNDYPDEYIDIFTELANLAPSEQDKLSVLKEQADLGSLDEEDFLNKVTTAYKGLVGNVTRPARQRADRGEVSVEGLLQGIKDAMQPYSRYDMLGDLIQEREAEDVGRVLQGTMDVAKDMYTYDPNSDKKEAVRQEAQNRMQEAQRKSALRKFTGDRNLLSQFGA